MSGRGVLPYLPAFLVLLVVGFLDSPSNDKFQFWYAGHLVATGRSPYDTAAWADAGRYGSPAALVAHNCADPASASCRWVYVPWTAWIYAPFGLLDPAVGMLAMSAVLLVASAIALVLLSREAGLRGPQITVFTLAAAASAPYVWNTFLGHFGALELVSAALTAVGLRLRRSRALIPGGALLSLKPHLFFVLIPAVAAWLAARRAWRVIAVTAAALGTLAAIGVASDARFLSALGTAGDKAGALTLPTTWSFAAGTALSFPLVAAVLIAVATIGASVTLRIDRAPLTLVATTTALSLVVAPYIHLYDHVMLLPAMAWCAARGYLGWIVCATFVAVEWLLFLQGPHGDEPAITALVPVGVLVALAVIAVRSGAEMQRE